MAFVITLLYIVLNFFRPEDWFPELLPFRPMLVLGAVGLILTVPKIIAEETVKKVPQTYLLLGFLAIVVMSEVLSGWLGGTLDAFQHVAPTVICFFLMVGNIDSLPRVRIVMITMIACCIFLVGQAVAAYHFGYGCNDNPRALRNDAANAYCKYLYHQFSYEKGEYGQHRTDAEILWRARATGIMQDPNDFAQFMLILIPFVWLSRRKGAGMRNLLLVWLPTAYLLYGIYLTHSRGALIGLAVLLLMALLPRFGKVKASFFAAGTVIALMGLNFAGGRAISAEGGADRFAVWGDAFVTMKSHPIFGVGFDRYNEYAPLTAHNSYMLCAVELGFVGLVVWTALWFVTLVDASRVLKWLKLRVPQEEVRKKELAFNSPFLAAPQPAMALAAAGTASLALEAAPVAAAPPLRATAALAVAGAASADTAATDVFVDDYEAAAPDVNFRVHQRYAVALRMSLITFLVTGWFLSRTYVVTLYMLLALIVAVAAVTERDSDGAIPQRPPFMKRSVMIAIGTMVFMWVSLHIF